MLLTRLAPDRATPLLARGRVDEEGRIVCGVHNASAVDAGQVVAASILAAVASDPGFVADVQGAAQEMDALRHDARRRRPDGPRWQADVALVSARVR